MTTHQTAAAPGETPLQFKSDPIDKRVCITLLQQLYGHLPQALIATAVNASLMAYIISSVVEPALAFSWLAAIVAVSLARAAAFFAFSKQPLSAENYGKWLNIFAAGVFVTAAIWGAGTILLFPATSPQHQAFIGFIVAGMAAGALGSMAADNKIFRIYLILTVAPYMLRLFAEGTHETIAMGAMCGAFILMLNVSASRNIRTTRDALRLRFINDELTHDLERTLFRNQATNNALQAEISKHQRTMESLELAVHDAKAALTAKSRFLANMSHEIRTPMNGVFGMTDLLMRTSLDARQKKLVGTINDSARSLLTIINDILDLSRIEAGKLDLDIHEFNLRDLAEQSVELFAGQCHKTGLDLSLYYDGDTPVFVKGDSGRLKQILLNLIGNAIKFTKFGEISVRVTNIDKGQNRSRVRIEVRDTGIGIDRSVLDKLFSPFEQAETSISRRFGGTGLGLAIARHLTDMMGGKISLESEPGKGTVAMIELPLDHGTMRTSDLAADPSVLDGARIIVIDDRDTNREITANYLESSAAKVSAAASTAAAWPMLVAAETTGRPFHAAIVDMVMPEENGLEFARRIKAHPSLSKLKIVIATSLHWHGDSATVRDAGIEAILTKPMRRADLINAAARAVTGSRHAGWRSEAARNGLLKQQANGDAWPSLSVPARVLIAEDNPVNVEVARELLTSFGCSIEIATNGLEAIAAVKRQTFDLVFMDCQMAIMDGLTATRRIRAYENDASKPRLPIVALTANAFAEDRDRCIEAGMDGYLSKPYSEQQLYDTLMKWLPDTIKAAAMPSDPQKADQTGITGSAPQTTETVLDEATLAPMRAKRPELLARIIKSYLEHAPKVIDDLKAAAAGGDIERLGRQAHSLKSSSANIGALPLSAICRELEATAKGDDTAACKSLTEKICASFTAVEQALRLQIGDTAIPTPAAANAG